MTPSSVAQRCRPDAKRSVASGEMGCRVLRGGTWRPDRPPHLMCINAVLHFLEQIWGQELALSVLVERVMAKNLRPRAARNSALLGRARSLTFSMCTEGGGWTCLAVESPVSQRIPVRIPASSIGPAQLSALTLRLERRKVPVLCMVWILTGWAPDRRADRSGRGGQRHHTTHTCRGDGASSNPGRQGARCHTSERKQRHRLKAYGKLYRATTESPSVPSV